MCFRQTFACVEGAFYNGTGAHVAHFSTYKSCAFARFYMLEFYNLPCVAIDGNSYVGFKFVG